MFWDLIHLVFPRNCAGCESPLVRQEEEICIRCFSALEETGFAETPSNNELFFRFAGKVRLRGAASFWYFDKAGRIQKIIGAIKYQHQKKLAEFLGRHVGLSFRHSSFLEEIDSIIPVPLHPKKEALRGFNQAERFAKGFSLSTGIPLEENALIRKINTSTQTKKNKLERWENVKEGFSVNKPVSGNVLLVDDVITTGATLEACIRTLEKSNPDLKSVSIGSIAVTRKISS